MCEANAYLRRGNREELVLEAVDKLIPGLGQITMVNIFGEQKILKAKILELSLVDHKIILGEDND